MMKGWVTFKIDSNTSCCITEIHNQTDNKVEYRLEFYHLPNPYGEDPFHVTYCDWDQVLDTMVAHSGDH